VKLDRALAALLFGGMALVAVGLAAVAAIVFYYGRDLPKRLDAKASYRPPVVSRVYDRAGVAIAEFYHQRRFIVPLSRIPPHVVNAFLAAEDARFFKHRGVDVAAILRALLTNLRHGEIREGGSTITQQLVRSLLLSPERTFRRKVREAILAYRLERHHSKEEILYLYLNHIYLGNGNYGVEAASRDYFGKGVESLNLAEAALLAGLPRAPSRSSPYRDFFAALERQRYVLRRLYEERWISELDYREALETPVRLAPSPSLNSQIAPYFAEHIRRLVGERYGFDPLFQGELEIFTSLDIGLQAAAQRAVREGLDELRLRYKSRTGGSGADEPEVQGALLAMEPATGMVRALVGGYDFSVSQYNRALQARRQPGSAFKPIVYVAALERGFGQLSVVRDAPLSFRLGPGKYWQPHNYQNRFFGPVTLRTALAHSLNSVAVRLAERVGVDGVIARARKLGIESRLERNLSLALGASSVTLLEMVRAYAAFASGGSLPRPLFITRITDRDGRVLETQEPHREPVLPPDVAYVLTNMLENVVQSGTARRAAALGFPVAGKTGTSSEFRDAWFVGYTPWLVAGVWVGYDDHRSLGEGETGGKVALPIWIAFMAEAARDRAPQAFPVPETIEWVDVDFKANGYPMPLFESAHRSRIPVIGRNAASGVRGLQDRADGRLPAFEAETRGVSGTEGD
jgi:penicillin-binding protein 1A